MHDGTVQLDTIPRFLRRPKERAPARLEFRTDKGRTSAVPRPDLPPPHKVIHGGVPPVRPDFLEVPIGGAPKTRSVPRLAQNGVVDLTAHRDAAKGAPPNGAHEGTHAGLENGQAADEDLAFQVTLPRSVIRQIRLQAAEDGTTHRAIVLRALRAAGLAIPAGADVDRRVAAARRRQQA